MVITRIHAILLLILSTRLQYIALCQVSELTQIELVSFAFDRRFDSHSPTPIAEWMRERIGSDGGREWMREDGASTAHILLGRVETL